MNSKTYKLPNGKTAVFEYDVCEIGKVTLECMDELMAMIADRPQGEWRAIDRTWGRENWICTHCSDVVVDMPTYKGIALYAYCPNCGAKMKGADDE